MNRSRRILFILGLTAVLYIVLDLVYPIPIPAEGEDGVMSWQMSRRLSLISFGLVIAIELFRRLRGRDDEVATENEFRDIEELHEGIVEPPDPIPQAISRDPLNPDNLHSIINLRSIEMVPISKSGQVLLEIESDDVIVTETIDDLEPTHFWCLYFLLLEYDTDRGGKSWLKYPERHLDAVDIVTRGRFNCTFREQVDTKYSMEYDSAEPNTVSGIKELYSAIERYDWSILGPLADNTDIKDGLSWMFNGNGGNRRRLRSKITTRLSRIFTDSRQFFIKEPEGKIIRTKPRQGAFRINPALDFKVSLPARAN